jgi:hypothetical protein
MVWLVTEFVITRYTLHDTRYSCIVYRVREIQSLFFFCFFDQFKLEAPVGFNQPFDLFFDLL